MSWGKEKAVGGKEGEGGSAQEEIAGRSSQQTLQVQVSPFRQIVHDFKHLSMLS